MKAPSFFPFTREVFERGFGKNFFKKFFPHNWRKAEQVVEYLEDERI
jgi:hypothetical protein